MFIYENDNSLNLTFKGKAPVENPEVVIKGYTDGASLTVNGKTYGVKEGTEFEGNAKTFAYQKDGKLLITFRGLAGMTDPEVTIDEIENDVFAIIVSGESVTLSVVDGNIIPVAEEVTQEDTTEEPVDILEETLDTLEEQPSEVSDEDFTEEGEL